MERPSAAVAEFRQVREFVPIDVVRPEPVRADPNNAFDADRRFLRVLSERRDRADDEEKSRKRRGDNTFAHNETLSNGSSTNNENKRRRAER